MHLVQHPEQALADQRHGVEAAVIDHTVQPLDVLRIDLVDQLRPHPQAAFGADLLPRRHAEARTVRFDAVAVAVLVEQEQRGLVLLRDPGAEEVMLQHRQPAPFHRLVQAAIVEVILVKGTALVAVVVPGRTIEGERIRVGHALLDGRRYPLQATVDITLPWRCAVVADLVTHGNGITAPGKGVGPADAHAIGAGPDKRHHQRLLTLGQPEIGSAFDTETSRLRHSRTLFARPAGHRAVRMGRLRREQFHRGSTFGLALRELQQAGLINGAAIQLQVQHIGHHPHPRRRGRCHRAGLRLRHAFHRGLRYRRGRQCAGHRGLTLH